MPDAAVWGQFAVGVEVFDANFHATDFRDVLGELVSTHLGNPNIKTILPSHEFKKVGLV